jgi:hypothetical protein
MGDATNLSAEQLSALRVLASGAQPSRTDIEQTSAHPVPMGAMNGLALHGLVSHRPSEGWSITEFGRTTLAKYDRREGVVRRTEP